MKVVYLVGPFRGPSTWAVEQNIRRAEEIALEVWRAGGVALCPHLNTRYFQGELPDEVWLRGDLELLWRCDAVLVLPGWSESDGSWAEVCRALDLGRLLFFWDHEDDRRILRSYLAHENPPESSTSRPPPRPN